jgi:predicted dehydrogenase
MTRPLLESERRHDADPAADPPRPVRVALVGCGYWGPNLIRNFTACQTTELAAVCDRDPQRLHAAGTINPHARRVEDFNEILADTSIDAVAVATPPQTHGPLVRAALQAGKHALVEKPIAVSLTEANDLVHLARHKGLTLMVDHTFVYSPAIRKIKEIIDSGELGQLYYIDSVRINLGLFQNDVNVLWDLATHDLAIVDYLLGRMPLSLAAFGSSHTGNDLEDVAYLSLDFGEGLLASFHVNWLSPVKVRHLIIGGSKKGLVYNDLDPSEPIKIYDRGITVAQHPEARRGILIGYRMGDVWSPRLEKEEPLQNVVRHFAACVQQGVPPLTDGLAGVRVVRILDLAQRSIKAQGSRLHLHDRGRALAA